MIKTYIDLHIHTEGDSKREIDNKSLLDNLFKKGVTLASITDHKKFDLKKFNTLFDNDKKIVFIPGIEIDVNYGNNNDYKQLILYCEDKEIINSFNDESYPIEWESLLKKIKDVEEKTLISLHFLKDEKRSFLIEEANEIKTKNPKLKIMLEAPSLQRASTKQNLDFHISAFSDVKDWAKYCNTSLPSNDDSINSLIDYIDRFVESKMNAAIDKKENENYNIGESFNNKSMPLSTGLNIIFGSKGSGKTYLIEAFEKTNKKFTSMQFSKFIRINNLKELNKKWIDEVKESSEIIEHNKRVNEMKREHLIEYEKKVLNEFNIVTFKLNSDNYNRNSKVIRMLNGTKFVKSKELINATTIDKIRKNFEKINKKLIEIIEIISNKNYKGNIEKEEIIKLAKTNISDWTNNGLEFKQKRFVNKFKKSIKNKFSINFKPKIGLEDMTLDWYNKTLQNTKAINFINKIINETKKEIKIIDSQILGDKYILKLTQYKMEKLNYKPAKSIHDFSNRKFKNNKDLLKFYNDIVSENFDDLIIKHNIEKIKASDIYDIKIDSKFGKTDDYIPSSGQMDMLYLDEKIKDNNKNILIDEFCNSLDSQYIYIYILWTKWIVIKEKFWLLLIIQLFQ